MHGIFISYRRDDAPGYAGRLYDRLAAYFGDDRVFMDVEGIEPGVDFVEAINSAVGSCEVLIVIIGKDWLAKGTDGRSRLEDPADFVRLETSAALARGIRVVPVLVEGAAMPRADQLPKALDPLVRRQAVELSHGQWEATSSELIRVLERILKRETGRNAGVAAGAQGAGAAATQPWTAPPGQAAGAFGLPRLWWGAIAGLVVIAGVAAFLLVPSLRGAKPVPQPGRLAAAPDTIEFAEQPLRGGGTGSSAVVVRNEGGTALRLADVKVDGAAAADFVIVADQCGRRELLPAATCSVQVSFRPRASGARAASLMLTQDGDTTPLRIAMRGRATEPPAVAVSGEKGSPPKDKRTTAPDKPVAERLASAGDAATGANTPAERAPASSAPPQQAKPAPPVAVEAPPAEGRHASPPAIPPAGPPAIPTATAPAVAPTTPPVKAPAATTTPERSASAAEPRSAAPESAAGKSERPVSSSTDKRTGGSAEAPIPGGVQAPGPSADKRPPGAVESPSPRKSGESAPALASSLAPSAQPRILFFKLDAPSAEKTRLCYGVAQAERVVIKPQPGTVPVADRRCVTVAPAARTTYTLSAFGESGEVVTQSLDVTPPATAGAQGGAATGKAEPAAMTAVPGEIGKSRREALEHLEKAGFKGRVSEDKIDPQATGPAQTVIAQSPKPGTLAKPGDAVSLQIMPPAADASTPPTALQASLPKVGDQWQYRVRSMWKTIEARTYSHRLAAASAGELRDALSAGDAPAETRSIGPEARLIQWRSKGYAYVELNPFLVAFGTPEPGTVWKSMTTPIENPLYVDWYSQGRVVGWESVAVPAGTFRALHVEVNSNRRATGSPAMAVNEPTRVLYAVWYAPEVKRMVKQVRTVFTPGGSKLDEDTHELVKFTVQ